MTLQANNVQTDCRSIPADNGDFGPPTTTQQAAIDQCGSDLTSIVDGSANSDLGLKLTQMTAAYYGLVALRQLQQDSLASSTTVGGLRQLYNDLVT